MHKISPMASLGPCELQYTKVKPRAEYLKQCPLVGTLYLITAIPLKWRTMVIKHSDHNALIGI